jgi:phage tail-like protein
MALTKDQIISDYPLPAYNYRVDIDTTTVAFSEVSGLEMTLDTITYSESQVASGKAGPNIMIMPGNKKPLTITLKKGYVKAKSISALYNWIAAIQLNRVDKKDITVHLCDEKGDSVVRWKVIDAFPTKLTAPSFSATSTEVAIESLELMASSLEMSES